MSKSIARTIVLGSACVAGLAGCSNKPEPTLPAEAFVRHRPAVGPGSNEPVDRPGALVMDAQHTPIHRADGPRTLSPEAGGAAPQTLPAMANFPAAPATRAASSQLAEGPATSTAGVSSGEFQSLGAIVAVVNGQPIFADKIFSALERPLRIEARRRDREGFRAVATELVNEEIVKLVNDEVIYAVADKALDARDHELARMAVVQWRKVQIQQAGGSEALARQRADQDGLNFDAQGKEQLRQTMVAIYNERKLFPLIQVNAQDIRRYYQDHQRDYNVPSAAKFRVIKIDVAKSGERAKAMEKAAGIYQQAAGGENFAELAGRQNDDPLLLSHKGAVGENGWMEKGAYVLDKVEQAVWKLSPGQVTPPIDIGDAIYIARLEEVRPGRTRPFESTEVQNSIAAKLRAEQYARLVQSRSDELRKNAVVVENPGMSQVALDMIMQRYPQWAEQK